MTFAHTFLLEMPMFDVHHDVSAFDACLAAQDHYYAAMDHLGAAFGGYVDGGHGVTPGDVAHAAVDAYGASHAADTLCDPGLGSE